jgi:hypothetical protein
MEPTECSEMSAFNIQTPGKCPEENIPYLQHGERLKTAPYFFRILIKLKFSGRIFEKLSNTKFHKNPSNGGRVFPCERTKLGVPFLTSVKAPKDTVM